MMKIMVRFLKVLIVFAFLFIGFDYFYVTSDYALVRTSWLNAGEISCGDIYVLGEKDLPYRDKTWSVQYRFVDVILLIHDDNGNEICRYASKGINN